VFCDVFCEQGYFGLEEAETILAPSESSGSQLKVHADELTSHGRGGAGSAARRCLGQTSGKKQRPRCRPSRKAGGRGRALPGVSFLPQPRIMPLPGASSMAGVPVAIRPFQPGSCMSFSMPLMMMTIACTQIAR